MSTEASKLSEIDYWKYFFFYVVVVLVVCAVLKKFLFGIRNDSFLGSQILLVIAHPDDESMFFLPFIYSCLNKSKKVSLLCLSKGIEPGLTRYQELMNASRIIGITNTAVHGINCFVRDEDIFHDGMNQNWPADVIAKTVNEYQEKWKIDTIVTFDQYGVSGHPNHIQTHFGVLKYAKSKRRKCKVGILFS